MVPAKKHPLEVFRKYGGGFTSQSASRKQNGSRSKSAKPGGAGKASASKSKAATSRSRTAPGDQRFTLSLNGVLFIAVVIVGLSLSAYFLGYQKGQKVGEAGSPNLPLKQQANIAEPGQNIGEYRVQNPSNKEVTPNPSEKTSLLYGVQVGTWDTSKSNIAKEANQWLQKNGYNSRLYPFANGEKLIIIVGSFFDRQDKELSTLLERIRAINDYPYGQSSPFKDARIKPFSLKGTGN